MRHRVISGVLLTLSLLSIGAGYLILHPEIYQLCPLPNWYMDCFGSSWIFGVGKPLFWGVRWLPPVFIALMFVNDKVFNLWLKIMLPLSLLALILIIKTPYEYLGITFYALDRTEVTERLLWLIDIISAVVIAGKYMQIYMHTRNSRKIN